VVISDVPICLTVPELSLVVVVAVKEVVGLPGFFIPVDMLIGIVTSYVFEIPDFSNVPLPIPTLDNSSCCNIVLTGKPIRTLSTAPVIDRTLSYKTDYTSVLTC
jgi:hypothetical protein